MTATGANFNPPVAPSREATANTTHTTTPDVSLHPTSGSKKKKSKKSKDIKAAQQSNVNAAGTEDEKLSSKNKEKNSDNVTVQINEFYSLLKDRITKPEFYKTASGSDRATLSAFLDLAQQACGNNKYLQYIVSIQKLVALLPIGGSEAKLESALYIVGGAYQPFKTEINLQCLATNAAKELHHIFQFTTESDFRNKILAGYEKGAKYVTLVQELAAITTGKEGLAPKGQWTVCNLDRPNAATFAALKCKLLSYTQSELENYKKLINRTYKIKHADIRVETIGNGFEIQVHNIDYYAAISRKRHATVSVPASQRNTVKRSRDPISAVVAGIEAKLAAPNSVKAKALSPAELAAIQGRISELSGGTASSLSSSIVSSVNSAASDSTPTHGKNFHRNQQKKLRSKEKKAAAAQSQLSGSAGQSGVSADDAKKSEVAQGVSETRKWGQRSSSPTAGVAFAPLRGVTRPESPIDMGAALNPDAQAVANESVSTSGGNSVPQNSGMQMPSLLRS